MYFDRGRNSENLYSREHKENVRRFLLSEDFRKGEFFVQNLRMRSDLNICATPFFLSSFFTLQKSPHYEESRFLYGIVSLAGFLLCLAILMRRVLTMRADVILLTAVLFLFFYHPLSVSLQLGNVNEILLLLIAVMHAFQKGSSPGAAAGEGAFLGVLVLLKPLFLASALLLLFHRVVRKKWKAFACGFFSLLSAGVLASGMMLGFDSWFDWIAYLCSLDISYWAKSIRWGNVSPAASFFQKYAFNPGGALFALLTAAALAGIYRMRSRPDGPVVSMGLFWTGFFIFGFSSPLFWYHYHSLNAVPLVLLLAFSIRAKTAFARNGYAALFIVLFIVIGQFMELFPVFGGLGMQYLAVLFSGTFLLALAVVRETFFSGEGVQIAGPRNREPVS
jgi:hypothetical protein